MRPAGTGGAWGLAVLGCLREGTGRGGGGEGGGDEVGLDRAAHVVPPFCDRRLLAERRAGGMRHLLLALLLLGGARADDEEKKEDVGTVVGIDLGTTYSWCVENRLPWGRALRTWGSGWGVGVSGWGGKGRRGRREG